MSEFTSVTIPISAKERLDRKTKHMGWKKYHTLDAASVLAEKATDADLLAALREASNTDVKPDHSTE